MNKLVEVSEYSGEGYKPLVYFESWRVAILNDAEKLRRETTTRLERHNETDEVFVLLEGKSSLLIGDGKEEAGRISLVPLERNKIYNVKKGVWHAVISCPGTSILIVENATTSKQNSCYLPVTPEMLSNAE